jgi:hypothetical protein
LLYHQIGGEGQASMGADRLKYKDDNRKADPGYLLIGTGAEVTEMKSFRKMDVLTTKILRLLIHSVTIFFFQIMFVNIYQPNSFTPPLIKIFLKKGNAEKKM